MDENAVYLVYCAATELYDNSSGLFEICSSIPYTSGLETMLTHTHTHTHVHTHTEIDTHHFLPAVPTDHSWVGSVTVVKTPLAERVDVCMREGEREL